MSSTIRIISVRSQSRSAGDETNFRFNLEKDLVVKKVCLLSASIPSTFYNVPNQISMNTGLGVLVITVGNYSIADLVLSIDTKLKALDPNFSCTFNSITMKVTISNTINFNLPFDSTVNGDVLAGLLGYEVEDYTGSSGYQADNVPDMYYDKMHLVIPEVGMLAIGANSDERATFIIPNESLRGQYISFRDMKDFQQFDFNDGRTIAVISVYLKWPDGTFVDLNGANWSFELGVS